MGRGLGLDEACVQPPHYNPAWEQGAPADQIVSPSVRVPDWGQGGAPHLATNFFPGVLPYFPLVQSFFGL